MNLFYPFNAYHHDASIEGVFPAWYPLECSDSRQQSAGNVSGMAHLLHRICSILLYALPLEEHPMPQIHFIQPRSIHKHFSNAPSTRIAAGRWPTPM